MHSYLTRFENSWNNSSIFFADFCIFFTFFQIQYRISVHQLNMIAIIDSNFPCNSKVHRANLTYDVIWKVAPFVLSKLWILIADWSMRWSRDTFIIKLWLKNIYSNLLKQKDMEMIGLTICYAYYTFISFFLKNSCFLRKLKLIKTKLFKKRVTWPAHWPISDELLCLQIQNNSSRSNLFDDVTR